MFAEKSWGSFRVLDVEDASMTIKITLTPGHGMNYHSHENRDEVWTVISGTGHAILDGVRRDVKPGDILTMPAGCRHTVFADSDLKSSRFSSVRPSAWRISRSIRCRRLDSGANRAILNKYYAKHSDGEVRTSCLGKRGRSPAASRL